MNETNQKFDDKNTPAQIRLVSSPPMKSRMGMEGDSEDILDALIRKQSRV